VTFTSASKCKITIYRFDHAYEYANAAQDDINIFTKDSISDLDDGRESGRLAESS
jgi:hypothetical protein